MSRGDHLWVRRGRRYTHHGIDCGDGTVIHFVRRSALRRGVLRRVERTSWAEFARGAEVHVRSYRSRLTVEAIITRAESRLGRLDYSLVRNNCEHLASWASTGYARSSQVRRWAVVAPGAAVAAAVADAAGVHLSVLGVLGAVLAAATAPLRGSSRRSSRALGGPVTEPRVSQGA